MKKWLTGLLILVAIAAIAAGIAQWYFSDRGRWTTEPEFTGLARAMSGGALVSGADPAVTLRFDPAFTHIGGQKFVLYGVADTEQHFFVETNPGGELRALFWVQFEAYLPDNDYRYDYDDSPARLTLGDLDFYLDTAAVKSDPNRKRRRGTDGALARQFLGSQGYAIPRDYFYARLVHLTDESRRKELMIIYIEDLASQGLAAAALQPDGAMHAQWPEIERRHVDRIRSALTPLRSTDER